MKRVSIFVYNVTKLPLTTLDDVVKTVGLSAENFTLIHSGSDTHLACEATMKQDSLPMVMLKNHLSTLVNEDK